MTRVEFSVQWEDVDYFEVDLKYYPGTPATRDYPGDGAEIEPRNIVHVHYMSGLEDFVTWDTFVLWYASVEGLTLDAADRKIIEQLTETAEESYWDDYDGPGDGEAWSGGFADNH